MRVTSYCRKCLKGTRFPLAGTEEVSCVCGEKRTVTLSETLKNENKVDVCALCGCGYFYLEKDFPAWLGAGIMLAGVIGFLIMTFHNIAIALGILLGVGVLDFIVYQFIPLRTICYQCLAMYRGNVRNPDHGGYELGTAGRFTDDYEEQREQMKL